MNGNLTVDRLVAPTGDMFLAQRVHGGANETVLVQLVVLWKAVEKEDVVSRPDGSI